ncbi:MAG: hypothetical protein WC371_01685 [Parachlamydiales bacterium]|jgi:hypothetical protein
MAAAGCCPIAIPTIRKRPEPLLIVPMLRYTERASSYLNWHGVSLSSIDGCYSPVEDSFFIQMQEIVKDAETRALSVRVQELMQKFIFCQERFIEKNPSLDGFFPRRFQRIKGEVKKIIEKEKGRLQEELENPSLKCMRGESLQDYKGRLQKFFINIKVRFDELGKVIQMIDEIELETAEDSETEERDQWVSV